MKVYLPEIVKPNGALDLSSLHETKETRFISVMGQDGSGKTTLRDNLAEYYSNLGYLVVTAKSPCNKYIVGLLNNAISQNGYEDWYTEQLLFSFCDGLLSNYMRQLDKHCDFFICQRGPADQYDHGITRSGRTYMEIHNIQRPERLYKFDDYIHLNCDAKVAWSRICDDEGKDRYEYPEYFERQVQNTKVLYCNIIEDNDSALDFLRDSRHYYLETTNKTTDETFKWAVEQLSKN